MQLFRIGKKDAENPNQSSGKPKNKMDIKELKRQAQKGLRLAGRYQTTIIALGVALLLAVTALRMLRYMDPPLDDNRVQQNLSKFKQVRIDQKTVQKIKSLQDSGASTNTSLQTGRNNPFSE
jgi:hypothetical protein